MLMQMAWILAIIGTITEVMLVHKVKYVDKAYTKGTNLLWVKKWHVDGVVWNTVGSFGLSYVQGIMFGATGLVIAVGGALGTGLSMLYFELEKWIQSTYGHKTVLLYIKAQLPKIKEATAKTWQLAKDVWKVIHFCLKVITFPVWGTRAAINWWNNARIRLFTTTEGVT
jgi:hypothetical protein